jgi:hypothetical protein
MMTHSIKRKISIANCSDKMMSVVIEPLGDERNLAPKEKLLIDLTMWEDIDVRDHITIHYHNDHIVLFEDGDIDMDFCNQQQ